MEKYRIKEEEALALADFLMPMLQYYPEKRVTAQEMLNHKWLSMPENFEYRLNERDFERMVMIKKNTKKEKTSENIPVEDIIDSDIEVNLADDEDNDEFISEEEDNSDDSMADPDVINIQNFNNSFAAYGQHVDLAALDRIRTGQANREHRHIRTFT